MTGYYVVAGIDLRAELARFIALELFAPVPGIGVPSVLGSDVRAYVPVLKIRRCREKPRSRLGSCTLRGVHRLTNIRVLGAPSPVRGTPHHEIRISAYPGISPHDVRETLLHELVHAFVGLHQGHGPRFKMTLRRAAHQAFGVQPILLSRCHGEISRLLGGASPTAAAFPAPPTAPEDSHDCPELGRLFGDVRTSCGRCHVVAYVAPKSLDAPHAWTCHGCGAVHRATAAPVAVNSDMFGT